ncbi:hypothetical protein HYC85_008802 [Camellia sinensis]|uniref:Uncharacterized protein n=1 Tax=Camellia sinensis TaxID=4442 RepID=A0A7J7HV50_CAMSI|nr:hypothetical protein HYC85_008802 [Camellia sinensis]
MRLKSITVESWPTHREPSTKPSDVLIIMAIRFRAQIEEHFHDKSIAVKKDYS